MKDLLLANVSVGLLRPVAKLAWKQTQHLVSQDPLQIISEFTLQIGFLWAESCKVEETREKDLQSKLVLQDFLFLFL